MLRANGYIVSLSLAVLAFACVATPRQAQELDAARIAIQRVEAMNSAEIIAGAELNAARASLYNAESIVGVRGAAHEVSVAARLAKRHADLAGQQIALAAAKEELERAEAERQAAINATKHDVLENSEADLSTASTSLDDGALASD